MLVFFFFKQRTAYEMRISDWSSDVCSSDLLAVALGARHAEVAAHLGLDVAALLVADDHHAAAADAAQAADDGGVVGIGAVAGQFLELVADHPDVIVGVRPRGVARPTRYLPRGEVAKDRRGGRARLVPQRWQPR